MGVSSDRAAVKKQNQFSEAEVEVPSDKSGRGIHLHRRFLLCTHHIRKLANGLTERHGAVYCRHDSSRHFPERS